MKTRDAIERLKACESMYEAGRAATTYFFNICESDPSHIPSAAGFRVQDILACRNDLEHTYLIRMFAFFEATLRTFWQQHSGKKSSQTVYRLMNRIASQRYMPFSLLNNAHGVREFRNTLIHGGTSKAVGLAEARSHLCRFLSNLPQEW